MLFKGYMKPLPKEIPFYIENSNRNLFNIDEVIYLLFCFEKLLFLI